MNKTKRLDLHSKEITGLKNELASSLVNGLPDLYSWLGIQAYGYLYSRNKYTYPDPCLQQQLDAICDYLKIDVKTIPPVGKKVVATKQKSPSKKIN